MLPESLSVKVSGRLSGLILLDVLEGGLTFEISRQLVDVNLIGVANGIRSFVPHLIAQGEGHVVNTASAAGFVTGPGMASYFATKHGVVALTEALAFDLALSGATGVGCTVVCPEFVNTRIHEAERNLPADVSRPPEDTEATTQMRAMFSAFISNGMPPNEVASKVVDAVRANRFYVLPHDTTLDLARNRWARIEENRPPV